MKGKLYMLPSSLAETTDSNLFNPATASIIKEVDHYIVEKTKTTRRFIRAIQKDKNIDNCTFQELNKHTDSSEVASMLIKAMEGENMAMISEAGCPGIADPGSVVAKMAHEKDIKVVPIPGPSSIYLALMASGFNGQKFTFHGYLAKEQDRRVKQIKQLERSAISLSSSQIFMETPFRNGHLFDDLLKHCSSNTLLCVACNITGSQEFIKTKAIKDWKKGKTDLHKKPCIFILGV